jgi:hypothetical protein
MVTSNCKNYRDVQQITPLKSLRRQGTIAKELGSCLHRKPWIPAGVDPNGNRGRNDNMGIGFEF